LVRNVEKLSGYYEMPMAIAMRIVMTVATVMALVVVVAMTMAVLMILVMMVPMMLLGMLSGRPASLDMDMGNVVVRMVVPQGGAKPRHGSRVEQQ
jgi:hypothetical protein